MARLGSRVRLATLLVFCFGVEAQAQEQSITYHYDALGRVVKVIYSNGASATYAYDKAGHRTEASSTPRTPSPAVEPISAQVPYNTQTSISLAPSGSYTSLSVVTSPTKGAVSISGTAATYTPVSGYIGADSFTYAASGPGGVSAPATVSITVGAPAAPAVSNVSASTGYNTPVVIGAAPTGVWTSVNRVTSPSNGVAVGDGDRSWTYTPGNGFHGVDSWTYTATGPGGTSAAATVTVTVAKPAAPTVSAVSAATGYNTAKSIALTPSGVYSSLAVVGNPAKGSVSINGTTANYTPNLSAYGGDSFTYKAIGPGGESAPAIVSVTIANPPSPAASDISVPVGYNSTASVFLPGGGDWVSLNLLTQPARGSLGTWTWANGGWNIPYTPNAGVYGADSFVYNISNPGGSSPNRTVTLNIATPPAPGAAAVSATSGYNTATSITLAPSGVYSSLAIVANPTKGSVSIDGTTATYTPSNGAFGGDSFTYRAIGPGGQGAPATVTVTIANPPAPTAADVNASTTINTPVSVSYPIAGDYAQLLQDTAPQHGTVINSGFTATYTPSAGYSGVDSWTYHASNPGGSSAVRTVTVNVVNRGPVAQPDAVSTYRGAATTFDPRINDSDPDGDNLSIVSVSAPAKGNATVNGGSSITYTPSSIAQSGSDSFTYTISDGRGATSTASVAVSLLNRNPQAVADSVMMLRSAASTTFYPLTNDSDPEGDALSFVSVGPPDAGAVTSVSGGAVTYQPFSNALNVVTIPYTISDGQGGVASSTITISFNSVPNAVSDTVYTAHNTAVTFDPRVNDSDPDGHALIIVGVGPTTNGGSVANNGTSLTYTPASGFSGVDAFAYTISDGHGGTANGSVSVTVQSGNRAPVANPDSYRFERSNTARTLAVRANDSDPDGDALSIIGVTQPGNGVTVTFNSSAVTLSRVIAGSTVFTYTISDGNGHTATATVEVIGLINGVEP